VGLEFNRKPISIISNKKKYLTNKEARLLKGIVVFDWMLLMRFMTQAVLASCPPVLQKSVRIRQGNRK
jgi:hypothetical protein